MTQSYPGLPGVQNERHAQSRHVLLSDAGKVYLPGGRMIDGSQSRDVTHTGDTDILRAGLLMGKVGATGLFAPATIGALSEAYDSTAGPTGLSVTAAVATEVQRRLGGTTGDIVVIGPPSAGGQVRVAPITLTGISIVDDDGTLLCADAGRNFVAGSLIGIDDGSYLPVGVLDAPWGVKATDLDGNDADAPLASLLVGGVVDTSQLIGWPTDTSLQCWLRAQLREHAPGLIFADDFDATAGAGWAWPEPIGPSQLALETPAGITTGPLCCKRWNTTQLEALLDGTEQEIMAVNQGDVIVRVTLVVGTAAGATCTVDIGLDATADGSSKVADGLLKDADANSAAIYRSDDATYAGDYSAAGFKTVAAAGNILLTASTDQSSSNFVGELIVEYLPALA